MAGDWRLYIRVNYYIYSKLCLKQLLGLHTSSSGGIGQQIPLFHALFLLGHVICHAAVAMQPATVAQAIQFPASKACDCNSAGTSYMLYPQLHLNFALSGQSHTCSCARTCHLPVASSLRSKKKATCSVCNFFLLIYVHHPFLQIITTSTHFANYNNIHSQHCPTLPCADILNEIHEATRQAKFGWSLDVPILVHSFTKSLHHWSTSEMAK